MSTITYADKSAGDLFTPADANEIKSVVNANVGLTEWSATYTYAKDQIVQYQGVFVKSVQDSNLNHTPDITTGGDTTWWEVVKTGGSVEVEGILGEACSKGDVLYFGTDGLLYVASNDLLSTAVVSGLAQADGTTSDPMVVVKGGLFTFDSAILTAGVRYYLGEDGALVTRDAVANTAYLVSLGVAKSTTELDVAVGMPEWNPARYDDGNPVGSLHRFPTYKDRPGYLPFAFDNAVKKSIYPDLYDEVGDVFEAMHVAAGDSASAADEFYPTPIPGYYERTGRPDITGIDSTVDIDLVNDYIYVPADGYNNYYRGGRNGFPIKVVLESGALPTSSPQIVDGGEYFVRLGNVGSNFFRLYPTEADSIADTNKINITATSTGTFRLTQEGVEIGDAFQGFQPGIEQGGKTYYLGSASATERIATYTNLSNYCSVDANTGFQGYGARVEPLSDGTNGTPRTSNETRPSTLYEFGYIKAEKGLPAGEPVSALRYQETITGTTWQNQDFVINHGLDAHKKDLQITIEFERDGVWPMQEIGFATINVDNYGYTVFDDSDLNSFTVKTASNGVLGFNTSGTRSALSDGNAGKLRVTVTKPEISGKVYEKIKDATTVTGNYTYTGIEETINVDAATATITLDSLDRKLKVRKINSGAGTITINPPTGATFTRAGLSSVTLTSDGDFWVFEPVSSTRIDLVDGCESGTGWKRSPDGKGAEGKIFGSTASGTTIPLLSTYVSIDSAVAASLDTTNDSIVHLFSVTTSNFRVAMFPVVNMPFSYFLSGRWYA